MQFYEINNFHSMTQICVKPENLFLDPNNPRITVISGGDSHYSDDEIVSPRIQNLILTKINKDQNHIADVRESILSTGFNANLGPFIVKEIAPGKYIVLEGNRRLTAIKTILLDGKSVPDSIISGLKKIKVSLFKYKNNNNFSEDEIVDIILSKIHVSGPLSWGAMEKAHYVYNSYIRSFYKITGDSISDTNFTMDNKVVDEVSNLYSFKQSEIRKAIQIYKIFKQLKDAEYEVDTKRFTLIDMAVSDAHLRSEYFELGDNCVFSNVGLDRFYELCVDEGCPVSNPDLFKRFAYISKKGGSEYVRQIESGSRPIEDVYVEVHALEGANQLNNKLQTIYKDLQKLNVSAFDPDDPEECELISKIVKIVTTKIQALNDESIDIEDAYDDDFYTPNSAQEALQLTKPQLRYCVKVALYERPNKTAKIEKLADYSVRSLKLNTRGKPRDLLLDMFSKEIVYMEDRSLIERYGSSGTPRYRLIS